MLTYNNNFVPLAQLKTINMPRQARKTSGLNNGHQLRDYSKSSNRSDANSTINDFILNGVSLDGIEVFGKRH